MHRAKLPFLKFNRVGNVDSYMHPDLSKTEHTSDPRQRGFSQVKLSVHSFLLNSARLHEYIVYTCNASYQPPHGAFERDLWLSGSFSNTVRGPSHLQDAFPSLAENLHRPLLQKHLPASLKRKPPSVSLNLSWQMTIVEHKSIRYVSLRLKWKAMESLHSATFVVPHFVTIFLVHRDQ